MNRETKIELTETEKQNQFFEDLILHAYKSNEFNVQITIDFLNERELKLPFNKTHAVKTLESVMQSLSKRLFKTAYRRFDKRLDYVAVIEPAPTTHRLHTHILTRRPESVSRFKFESVLRSVIQMNDYIPKTEEAVFIQESDNSDRVNLYELKLNENPEEREFIYSVKNAQDRFDEMTQSRRLKSRTA